MFRRGSPYGAPGRRELVGRAALAGGVLAGAGVLFALLVTVFGPASEQLSGGPATLPSAALAERGPATRPGSPPPDADANSSDTGSPDRDSSDSNPSGSGSVGSNPSGGGMGGPSDSGSAASRWESGWASAVPSPPDGSSDGWGGAWGSALPRARSGSVACTLEITDLAQLHAAMVNSGPDEIICVRGPQSGPTALAAVAFARSQLGEPYRWAGNGRADGGFDCSGLTSASYASVGIPIPRTAQAQFNAGPRVPPGQPLEPGDLVFFGSGPRGVGHVGLAISATKMINAPDVGQVVTVGPIQRRDYVGATRPVSRPAPSSDGGGRSGPNSVDVERGAEGSDSSGSNDNSARGDDSGNGSTGSGSSGDRSVVSQWSGTG